MHALFFTFKPCKAVPQTSLIGWISVQSLSCALLVHMAFLFLSYTKEKRQNYKEEYIYDRNKVQMGCLHLTIAIGLALLCVMVCLINIRTRKLLLTVISCSVPPIHRGRLMVFHASYLGCVTSQK